MTTYFRKVIRITAEDSPNVRYAQAQQRAGIEPDDKVVVPGVLTWGEYKNRRATWDKIRQVVGLDAQFYEGAEVKLYPHDWLARAHRRHVEVRDKIKNRTARAIGIDPAEGGDRTSMVVVDEYGIIEMVTKKTPDTNVIVGEAIAFMYKHNVRPDKVVFDRGGGGKQHADRLRAQGIPVRTVMFGEAVSLDPRRGLTPMSQRREVKEERTAFKNRRAEMYWELRTLLDPMGDPLTSTHPTFGIPHYAVDEPGRKPLQEQMEPIPLSYDDEGKMYVMPKQRKDSKDERPTLTEIIGHSPDELDALVLAVHGMTDKGVRSNAGAA